MEQIIIWPNDEIVNFEYKRHETSRNCTSENILGFHEFYK